MSLLKTRNRLGFAVLGLTNNFAYVIMLSAANDLLRIAESSNVPPNLPGLINPNVTQPYCNAHATSTILLADTLPSLSVKLLYPFLLVGVSTTYKALATALLSVAAFVITGMSSQLVTVFTGVVCASLSSGLGETTFLSSTPLYGDVSLSGWAIGTGAAGLCGAIAYALLKMVLDVKWIMLIMLIVPVAMMTSFKFVIVPLDLPHCQATIASHPEPIEDNSLRLNSRGESDDQARSIESGHDIHHEAMASRPVKRYGGIEHSGDQDNSKGSLTSDNDTFDLSAKIRYIPTLKKYFIPLLLVYFGEYFINQGLFEVIYIRNIAYLNLDKDEQYRWFQVSYQLGVMISRSSIELFQIRNIWVMSLLQLVNAIIFLGHTSKLYQIPSFYIIIALIIYEGLLGGFTYVNAFYRIKKEIEPKRLEFAMSTVTVADTFGIVMAGLVAIPVHDALCKLY